MTFLVIVFPLLAVLFAFELYTIQKEITAIDKAYASSLVPYRDRMDSALSSVDYVIFNTVINNQNFFSLHYKPNRNETHLTAMNILENFKTLLRSNPLISVIAVYSQNFDYYCASSTQPYQNDDVKKITDEIIAAAGNLAEVNSRGWTPVKISGRTVLLRVYGANNTVCAAVVDLSLDSLVPQEPDSLIFYASTSGEPYTYAEKLKAMGLSIRPSQSEAVTADGSRYTIKTLPLKTANAMLVRASPARALHEQLDGLQLVLIIASMFLVLVIPLGWLTLRKRLFHPLDKLAATMQRIDRDDFSLRADENSRVAEVRNFGKAFNTMIEQLEQFKIRSYEQKLEVQQAQLQYLELQIRPHFYLSCLNIIYSLAEDRQYERIQAMILDLSSYLRYIFKDHLQRVSLSAELRSVEAYIHIQQMNTENPPELLLDISSDAVDVPVPPMVLLTFVENAIKHARQLESHPVISIRASVFWSEEGDYLNLTVQDNGGGFTEDQIEILNRNDTPLFYDEHVGISNIRHRLRLMYGENATVSLSNMENGGFIEIFLPVDSERRQREAI